VLWGFLAILYFLFANCAQFLLLVSFIYYYDNQITHTCTMQKIS
jgi:hypothetical protein